MADRKGKDTETWEYLYLGDDIPNTALAAIEAAHSIGPNPLPVVGTQHPERFIFVQSISATQTDLRRDSFDITVSFGPPESGEDQEQQSQPNPLMRPAVYDVQYIEQEYVIEQARNVEEFTYGSGRPAGTLKPITNTLHRKPDEPQVDTTRNPVIVIEKNFATLGDIMKINEDFLLTCNSDTCNVGGREVVARRLKFLGATSQGRQQEGEVVYYPARIEIELKKTTDLKLSNIGYEFYNTLLGGVTRAKDDDGSYMADPINLDMNGEYLPGDVPIPITYRYLEEVAYAGFFS